MGGIRRGIGKEEDLGTNDKNSSNFVYIVRRGDIGDINNTNDSTTPKNGLVNGKECLEKIWSRL